MSAPAEPPLSEVLGVWTMAFGQPPIVNADAGLLLQVLRSHFPDVHAILDPNTVVGAGAPG